jgi:hypothetical protein
VYYNGKLYGMTNGVETVFEHSLSGGSGLNSFSGIDRSGPQLQEE